VIDLLEHYEGLYALDRTGHRTTQQNMDTVGHYMAQHPSARQIEIEKFVFSVMLSHTVQAAFSTKWQIVF